MAKTEEAKAPERIGPRMMHIRINRPHGSQEDSMYIGMNGKTWQLRYNTDVYVPEDVYYLIQQSLKAERAREAYIERLNG